MYPTLVVYISCNTFLKTEAEKSAHILKKFWIALKIIPKAPVENYLIQVIVW